METRIVPKTCCCSVCEVNYYSRHWNLYIFLLHRDEFRVDDLANSQGFGDMLPRAVEAHIGVHTVSTGTRPHVYFMLSTMPTLLPLEVNVRADALAR